MIVGMLVNFRKLWDVKVCFFNEAKEASEMSRFAFRSFFSFLLKKPVKLNLITWRYKIRNKKSERINLV